MKVFIQVFVGIFAILAYAFAYMKGGRDEKFLGIRPRIWRRFIAPLLLAIPLIICTYIVHTFKFPVLLAPASYIGAMFLTKYGGDTLCQKLRGRFLSGLVVGVASLPIAISTGSWKLFSAQVILAILAHLALGIKNPFPEKHKAQLEEFSISLLTVALVPFMVVHA